MKKWKVTAVLIGLLALLVGAAVGFYYYRISNMTLTVNGMDMTGKSAKEIAEELARPYDEVRILLKEGDSTELSGNMTDYGFGVDQSLLAKEIEQSIEHQTGTFFHRYSHLMSGVAFDIEVKRAFLESEFDSFVTSAHFATKRQASADGDVTFDENEQRYVVTEPITGNEIDDDKLRQAILPTLTEMVISQMITEEVSLPVPETAYREVQLSATAEELHAKADVLNQYAASKINYSFGAENVVLDIATFRDWMHYNAETNTVSLDDNAVALYVQNLAKTYNTQWKARGFQTTTGQIVTIPGSHNEYGYRVNESEEQARVKSDLASGQEVNREPCYYQTNSYGNPYHYSRNGVDDLAGTYVEVNLTRQHLWFYKNGQLVIESDLVSGDVSKGHETITGAFPIAFKRHPYTLSSTENGYSVNVQYWMPFYDGQGLHDASWRSSFGQDIYENDGSHGCVNLPLDAAKTIYENCEAGMAVILYQ